MAEPLELLLYTKPDCSLCDEMKLVLKKVSQKRPLLIKQIDITSDAKLESRYRHDIPLLFYNDSCLAKHKAHEKTILKKLEKIAGKQAG